jgi:branched-chain amino acid transport system ATP-binding protein
VRRLLARRGDLAHRRSIQAYFARHAIRECGHSGRTSAQDSHPETLYHFPALVDYRYSEGCYARLFVPHLAIARAVMSEPRVLLLDEPSAGLSPGMFDLVMQVVDELRAQGTAIVLVEQLVRT